MASDLVVGPRASDDKWDARFPMTICFLPSRRTGLRGEDVTGPTIKPCGVQDGACELVNILEIVSGQSHQPKNRQPGHILACQHPHVSIGYP
jgi:hypothetical protein